MDLDALRTLLEENHASAWGWAHSCCRGDRHEAFEVLHTAYVQILGGAARFEGRSSFKTWLFAVIRKTASKRRYQLWRRLQRLAELPGTARSQAGSAEDRFYRSELRRRIGETLGNLSNRQRQVLHLVFYQDLTVEEAAAVMGVSVGSARTHYHRGKDRLRLELTKAGLGHEQVKRGFGNQRAL